MSSHTANHLAQPGNQDVYLKSVEFIDTLKKIKAEHPLQPGFQYYQYNTALGIPYLVSIADRHRVDLKSFIEGKTVLDLACADGDFTFLLEQIGAKRVVAIDYGPFGDNRLTGFRTVADALESKAELIDADVHYLDFGPLPQFDTIFCFGFLYHSPHPMWVLEKLTRSTQRLFMTTKVFDVANDPAYAYFYAPGECNNDPTNWWCHTPRALTLMLERSGFTVQFMERLDPHIGTSDPVALDRDGRVFLYATRTGSGA